MKKTNYILVYIFALVLGWLTMSMNWAESIVGIGANGYDVGATRMLIPLGIIAGVSLIGFINLKILNIIADIICLLISLGTAAFMFYYMDEMSSSPFGGGAGIGATLMLIISIVLVVISMLTLIESIKGNKSTVSCSNCGSKLGRGQKFCASCGGSVESISGLTFNKLSKNQINTVLAMVIGVVVIGTGVLLFSRISGKGVSKKLIKEDFIGSTIRIQNAEIKVTAENIDEVKLDEPEITKEYGMEFYDNTGIITLKDSMYNMEIPFKVSYMKYGNNKMWELVSNNIKYTSDEAVISFNTNVSEEEIKGLFEGKEVRGVEIDKSIAEGLTIDSMEKDDYGIVISVEATPNMKDTAETGLTSLSGEVYFDGELWNIKYVSGTKDSSFITSNSTSNNNSNYNKYNNYNNSNNSTSTFGSTSEKLRNDYVMPNSHKVKLNFAELNEYTVEELFIARNELLARNGYSFKDKPNLKKYFQAKSWYKENPNFNGELTGEVEKWNLSYIESVEFIKMTYEKYGDISADYVLPGSSSKVQSVDDIRRLTDWELIIARNEIFGRYGLNFSVVELKRHFLSKSWFKVNNDIDNDLVLSEVENKNVSLILEEETKRLKAALNRDL